MSLQAIADRVGCPVRFLVGIRAVESGGDSRAIRFEPHLFQRGRSDLVVELPRGAAGDAARAKRLEVWAVGKIPYTPGHGPTGQPRAASSRPEETNRTAFERARALAPVLAVESTSWGSYQVLGAMFPAALKVSKPASAADVDAIVSAFDSDSQRVSDELLAAWLISNPKALAAARDSDVETFVSRYNGCVGAACEGYVKKFRAALKKFDEGKLKP